MVGEVELMNENKIKKALIHPFSMICGLFGAGIGIVQSPNGISSFINGLFGCIVLYLVGVVISYSFDKM